MSCEDPPSFFYKYRKKRKGSRVRLCGIQKKNIWGAVNLHKLSGKSGKTTTTQFSFIGKGYLFGKETLFPVAQEAADDIAAVTLIDGRIPVQEAFPPPFLLRGRK